MKVNISITKACVFLFVELESGSQTQQSNVMDSGSLCMNITPYPGINRVFAGWFSRSFLKQRHFSVLLKEQFV